MNREVHVQFFERAGVQSPCATHPSFLLTGTPNTSGLSVPRAKGQNDEMMF
jgi:hypothetical protein